MSNFKVTLATETRKNSIDWNNLGFGKFFSDHVYVSDYIDGKWTDGEIIPYGPMPFEPTLCTLHYGQTIFEGLKAFRSKHRGANIFRPDRNAKRLNHSGSLVCIPPFDENQFIEATKELVKLDNKFIPTERGQSLYIRPVVFGSGNFLGVHASDTYKLIIITSPVASYYKEGLNPVKIQVTSEYVRAAKGGLGSAKTAANYAASLLAGEKAKVQGYSQVLWLDAVTRHFVDEVGAMNIMFVIDDTLVTPSLEQGTILAGITRDTVLNLARQWGLKVREEIIKVDEIFDAHKKGNLNEVFGTGTAAVISPVGSLSYNGDDIIINNNQIGKLSQKFYDTITGIQYGEIDDINNWNVRVEF